MRLKISIVIPTRNRAEYLKYAIDTCLAANDPHFELIISDNNSTDNTRDVVAAFDNPHIRYIHTGESVSMRRNYEFALGHVTGDYILYLGDDDGIFKNGLATLRGLLETRKPDVVNWRHITYLWPRKGDDAADGVLKFRYRDFFGPLVEKSPQALLAEFCAAERTNYRDGANIYHGCVSRKLVDELKAKTGEYFCGQSPDVYAALANLTAAKTFFWIRNPVTIAGEGSKSSGAALSSKNIQTQEQEKVAKDFIALVERDTVPSETDLRIRSITGTTYALLSRVNKTLLNGKLALNHAAWREKSRADAENVAPDLLLQNIEILEKLFVELDPLYSPPTISTRKESVHFSTPKKKKKTPAKLSTTTEVAKWVDSVTIAPYDPSRISPLGRTLRIGISMLRKPFIF